MKEICRSLELPVLFNLECVKVEFNGSCDFRTRIRLKLNGLDVSILGRGEMAMLSKLIVLFSFGILVGWFWSHI